jgi:hypothetical protein
VACVAGVIVLAFGAVVSASSLSGRLQAGLTFDIDGPGSFLENALLPFEMATEFHVEGWTFAGIARFDSGAIGFLPPGDAVKFAAAGPLGAFDVISSMTFLISGPFAGSFVGVAAVRVCIGGLDLWGGATLGGSEVRDTATGVLLGARGWVDDVEFQVDMGLNAVHMSYDSFGGTFGVGFDTYWRQLLLCDLLAPVETCELGFTRLNVYAKFPLSCFEIEAQARFSGVEGFDFLRLWISGIDLELGGLTLGPSMIFFNVNAKSVFFDLGLRLPETFCITPYVSLTRDTPEDMGVVDGLSLDALELIWEIGDVTFIASELFVAAGPDTFSFYRLGNDARVHPFGVNFGGSSECFTPVEANEAIGIEVRRDGCCGATLGLGLYAFFDTDLPGTSLFDWSETRVTVEYGATSNLTVSGQLNADHEQVTSLGIAFEFLWGHLVIFEPDWQNACCGLQMGTL